MEYTDYKAITGQTILGDEIELRIRVFNNGDAFGWKVWTNTKTQVSDSQFSIHCLINPMGAMDQLKDMFNASFVYYA